jgi:hypothetical protein
LFVNNTKIEIVGDREDAAQEENAKPDNATKPVSESAMPEASEERPSDDNQKPKIEN